MMNYTPILPPPFSIDTDYSIGRHRTHRRRRNTNNYNYNNNNSPLHSIQSTLDNICTQLSDKLSQCNQQLRNNQLPPPHILLPSVISGTLAFYATSFSSQYVQYKLLKMSTGTRPTIIPISVGMATVAMGSWMSHLAGMGSAVAAVKYEEMNSASSSSSRIGWRRNRNAPSLMEQCTSMLEEKILPMKDVAFRTIHEMTRPMTILSNANNTNYSNRRTSPQERREAWFHAARICIIGLLTYKTIFRSNFTSLSPSSYTARGSFATKGIPIGSGSGSASSSSFNYASKSQRDALHKIGTRFGCHTCGTRLLFDLTSKFHGDHIPPISVAKQINNRWYNRKLGRTVAQRFYPQCTSCSSKQGGLLSRGVNAGHKNLHSVGGGSESYFHGWRLRMGHLTGGLVAAVSSVGVVDEYRNVRWVGSDEEEEAALVVRSSRDRIRLIQYWVEELIYDARQSIRNVWSGKW